MPINKKWPLAALLDAARRFPLSHGRRVTFEYVLLAGVNDSDADADRLPRLLRGIPAKVNLIPWNPFQGPDFKRPSAERIRTFQERLRKAEVSVYIRSPRGDDIDAACGQLAARELVQLSAPAHERRRRARRSTRARHRRLRPHRRVLGLHAHDGARVRPPVPVARAAAAGGHPGAPRHLGGQRVDDAGGARPLGRRPQDLGARPAARALPGRDRLLEDDLGRAQRARAPRDQRRRRRRQPGGGVRARRPGGRPRAPPGPTPTSSSTASRASARSAATARRCSTCCSGSSPWTSPASATCSR